MKITALWLFIILLIVLVLSIVFSRFLPIRTQEGLISFAENNKTLDSVNIPQYSGITSTGSVKKVYDNIFFDTKNGNMIEVNGAAYVGSTVVTTPGGNTVTQPGNVDSTGLSITGIYIINTTQPSGKGYNTQTSTTTGTNGQPIVTVTPYTTAESQIASVPTSYTSLTYNTQTTTTDPYQIFYITWDRDVYLHVINSRLSTLVTTYAYSSRYMKSYSHNYPANNSITVDTPLADNDVNNGSYVIQNKYDDRVEVYQISHSVQFDVKSGNLIIVNNDYSIKVYNRNGGDGYAPSSPQYPSTVEDKRDVTTPWIASDNANNIVCYTPISTNTLITIISKDTANAGKFRVSKVARFNLNGYVTENGVQSQETQGNAIIPPSNPTFNNFYQALFYWGLMNQGANGGSGSGIPGNIPDTSDYLLKTQIIPPVCPSCPSCQHTSGTCTNCGGQGGSGTIIDVSGRSAISGPGTFISTNRGTTGVVTSAQNPNATSYSGGQFSTNANTDTLGGATSVQTLGVVSGVEGVAKTGADVLTNTGTGVLNLAGKVVDTTGNIVTSAGSGAVDLLTSAGSGASNLLTSAGSGATNLLRSAGSGIANLGSGNNQQTRVGGQTQRSMYYSPPSYYGNGTEYSYSPAVGAPGMQGTDIYSRYGASPSRGSNFIPVTTDFSNFA